MVKRLRGGGRGMGEGCPGVTTPHFLAVSRSKEVAVHADSTAACYGTGKLQTRPISR